MNKLVGEIKLETSSDRNKRRLNIIAYERLNDKVQASAFWGRNPAHEESYCCMETLNKYIC